MCNTIYPGEKNFTLVAHSGGSLWCVDVKPFPVQLYGSEYLIGSMFITLF